jgi:DnaJ C terminal domain
VLLGTFIRSGQRARANQRGEDLHYSLPIDFVESLSGANKRLTLPNGGTLDVKIPPGLVGGQILRLRGKGAPGTEKGGPGDALIAMIGFAGHAGETVRPKLTFHLDNSMRAGQRGKLIFYKWSFGNDYLTNARAISQGHLGHFQIPKLHCWRPTQEKLYKK